jgi:hypothetical protein
MRWASDGDDAAVISLTSLLYMASDKSRRGFVMHIRKCKGGKSRPSRLLWCHLTVDPHLGTTVHRSTKILHSLESPVGFNLLRSNPFLFGHPCSTSRIDQRFVSETGARPRDVDGGH